MFSRQVRFSLEAAARVLIFWPPVCIPFAIAAHTNRRACAPVTVCLPPRCHARTAAVATSPEALGDPCRCQHNSTTAGRTCVVLITGRSRRCRRTELVPAGADRAERLCGVSGVSGGSDELSKTR